MQAITPCAEIVVWPCETRWGRCEKLPRELFNHVTYFSREESDMKVVISSIVVAIALLCGVQGNFVCEKWSSCGCELYDNSTEKASKLVVNITLNDFPEEYDINLLVFVFTSVSPFKYV